MFQHTNDQFLANNKWNEYTRLKVMHSFCIIILHQLNLGIDKGRKKLSAIVHIVGFYFAIISFVWFYLYFHFVEIRTEDEYHTAYTKKPLCLTYSNIIDGKVLLSRWMQQSIAHLLVVEYSVVSHSVCVLRSDWRQWLWWEHDAFESSMNNVSTFQRQIFKMFMLIEIIFYHHMEWMF